MPRKPKPMTAEQSAEAQELATLVDGAIRRAREAETEVRALVAQRVQEANLAAWRKTWEMLRRDGVSVTRLSDVTKVSRATLYGYVRKYEEYMEENGIEPVEPFVESGVWSIVSEAGGEFVVAHPSFGQWNAAIEEDGTVTVWTAGGVYMPLNRDNQNIATDVWDSRLDPIIELVKTYERPDDGGEQVEADGLDFLDGDDG